MGRGTTWWVQRMQSAAAAVVARVRFARASLGMRNLQNRGELITMFLGKRGIVELI